MFKAINFIGNVFTKKDKLKQKDELLALQAEEIAQLTHLLALSRQAKTELKRFKEESDRRYVDLMVAREKESEKFRLEKTKLEQRIRHLELNVVNGQLEKKVQSLEDQNEKMRETIRNAEIQSYTTQVTLSSCHKKIHELRKQAEADGDLIRRLKIQNDDLKKAIQNTPKPKPIGTPTCQICLYEFNETRRVPRMLACGHTICESCISQIREGPTLKCPFDRKEQHMGSDGVTGLPKNFAILEVMEETKKENTPIGKTSVEPVKDGKTERTVPAPFDFLF